eukprot:6055552-Alexandrium_andersonii.AAC.1
MRPSRAPGKAPDFIITASMGMSSGVSSGFANTSRPLGTGFVEAVVVPTLECLSPAEHDRTNESEQ